jgi:hypothetical protein
MSKHDISIIKPIANEEDDSYISLAATMRKDNWSKPNHSKVQPCLMAQNIRSHDPLAIDSSYSTSIANARQGNGGLRAWTVAAFLCAICHFALRWQNRWKCNWPFLSIL